MSFLVNYLLSPQQPPPSPQRLLNEDTLAIAAKEGDVATVRKCLESGINIDTQLLQKNTPLYSACLGGNAKIVEVLIRKGSNVNAKDSNGTLLHSFCAIYNFEAIQLLLDNGANINELDKFERYPGLLLFSCTTGPILQNRHIIVRLFSDMNVNAKSWDGLTALHYLCMQEQVEVVKLLLDETSPNVNEETNIWRKDLITSMPKCLANFNQETPLSIACGMGNIALIELLFSRGADINIRFDEYGSLLHLAILRKNAKVVQWLISKNINMSTTNKQGQSALELFPIEHWDICRLAISGYFRQLREFSEMHTKVSENAVNTLAKQQEKMEIQLRGQLENQLTKLMGIKSSLSGLQNSNHSRFEKLESQLRELEDKYSKAEANNKSRLETQQNCTKKLEIQLAELSEQYTKELTSAQSKLVEQQTHCSNLESQVQDLVERFSAQCEVVEKLRNEQTTLNESQVLSSEVTNYWATSVVKLYEELEDWRQSITILLESKYNKNWALSHQATAHRLYGDGDLNGAKAYLQVALGSEGVTETLKTELLAEITELEKISEEGMKSRLEANINAIKVELQEAAETAAKAISEEELKSIEEQKQKLTKQQEYLQNRANELASRQTVIDKQLEEHKLEREKWEEVIKMQQSHIDTLELMTNTTSTNLNTAGLAHQMSLVLSANADVQAVKLKLEGQLQNAKKTWTDAIQKEKTLKERLELLQKQMEVFYVKGLSPDRRAFRDYLKAVKRLYRTRSKALSLPFPLECFISYAWHPDDATNKALQSRLVRLKEDLEMAGLKVQLDIRNMMYDTKVFMVSGITKAHKVLLICTPRLKERAADPTPNNLQLELRTAITKSQQHPELITPLLFEGVFGTSVPPEVTNLLVLHFKENDSPDKGYYEEMASLAPLGLIPTLLSLGEDKDYKFTYDHLTTDLSSCTITK